MITRKIVLILGAGASMPFGFPSGAELRVQIINGLNPSTSHPMRSEVLEAGFESKHVEDFRTTLHKSGKKSVDAFLEHRTEFLAIGKVATACALLPCENEDRILAHNELNWYEYFFNKLNATFDDFDKNSVSALTFNYDRSLEHYLFTALQNSYGKSAEECAQKLRSLPIVHLYGQLGDLPYLNSKGIEFGAKPNPEVLRKAAEGIKIIHEDISANPEFNRAHELLRNAERICFLGFGYDQTNLRRLAGYGTPSKQDVIGSAMGLTDRECGLVRAELNRLGFRTPDSSTLESLRLSGSDGGLDPIFGETMGFLRHHCPLD
jgi:hypothetical protein